MPPYQQPPDQWFGQQLAAMKRDIAALKAQQTQFVVDSSGVAQAIIGNLAHDPSGNATGLSGVGVAIKIDSTWTSLSGSLHPWPQQAASLSIAAGSNQSVTFTAPAGGWSIGSGTWQPVVYLANGGFMDHCGWCVTGNTSTSVTISVANPSGSLATGTIYMTMFTNT